MSDSEPDFDDPRFLLDVPTTNPSDLSYIEKRKRKLHSSELKGRNKSRKQLEEEQREIGLSRNLVESAARREQEGGGKGEGEDKAFRMMKAMGFKPGESLGKKETQDSFAAPPKGFTKASFSSTSTATDPSTPSTSTSTSVASTNATQGLKSTTNEPIKFQIRTGRTGLGIPQRAPPSVPSPASSSTPGEFTIDSTPLPSLSSFLSHIRSTITSKKAYGILKSCRRTLEELDRRNGIEEGENVMWFDPDELEREEREFRNKRLFERLDKEVESEEETELGDSEKFEKRKEKSELDYLRGRSETVVDDPEDEEQREREEELKRERGKRELEKREEGTRKEEREEWFGMDVETRLALTLSYLRHHYNYCFYCGCQYNDAKDLEENCPGTEEEDH
ncbi:Cmg1p [Sporobolomyces salmoneus]|uniref:Cmg1p n=1 Tax=Sporobolomyces salmoneus TaxID=183962 RepID=UPI0031799D4C